MVRHYYHIYAGGINWREALDCHLNAIIASGFYEEVKPIRIGFVGTPDQIKASRLHLESRGIDYISINEQPCCWEQVTLDVVYEDALTADFKVFYGHTKGSTYRSILSEGAGHRELLAKYWRDDMTEGLYGIGRWQKAVELLDEYDMVGIYWMPKLNFFAGNFWATNTRYIRSIGPPDKSNRMDAESWLRKNRALRAYDMQPGYPSISNQRKAISEGREYTYWEPDYLKELGMIVTFRADGRLLTYSPGKIYREKLTPVLKKLLEEGSQLVLIDPPDPAQLSLAEPVPVVQEIAYLPEPEEVEDDSNESSDIPEATGPSSGQDYGDRAKKESGERPARSEKPSSKE